jgi:hypothetical protein
MLLIVAPRPYFWSMDRITVCSSRLMLRMIATVVVSERRAGAANRGRRAAPGSGLPRSLYGHSWLPASISSLLSLKLVNKARKHRRVGKIAE